MLVDPSFSLSLTQDYIISVVIILIASVLLLVVAIFGIIGAIKESKCALTTFFCLLLIIFVAEVSAGVWIHINRDSLKLQIKNAVEVTVEQEYYISDNRKAIFDTFQQKVSNNGTNIKLNCDRPHLCFHSYTLCIWIREFDLNDKLFEEEDYLE